MSVMTPEYEDFNNEAALDVTLAELELPAEGQE